MEKYLIGIDAGTSSIKGVALSCGGEIVGEEKFPVELLYPGGSRVEFGISGHCSGLCQVIRALTGALPRGTSVAAVALSGASGSTVLLDSSGDPLMNAICWMDERASLDRVRLLDSLAPADVHRISGWPFLRIFPLANLAWIREKEPDIYAKMSRFCTDIDYACHSLSGKWAIDFSSATPTYLTDQHNKKWHAPFLEMLGLEENNLSTLVPSSSATGGITRKARETTGLGAETILAAGAFDHPSAAIGTGVFNPGSLLISTGTSWVGFLPVRERDAAIGGGLLADPFLSQKGGCWGAIFSVPKIGAAVDAYLNRIFPEAGLPMSEKYNRLEEHARNSPPGADGLFVDLRSNEIPGGTLSGRHICRAIMEGAALLLRKKMEEISGLAPSFSRIVFCGGPSRSRLWTRILADITGVPLEISGGQSSGAIGAAIMAGTAAGIFRDEAEGFNSLKIRTETLAPDAGTKKIYDEIYLGLVQNGLLR